jgi:hypothetical protein
MGIAVIFGRAVEWMGRHKLFTGAAAAGVGFLVFSSAAKAHPALPDTKGVKPLPGGGIATTDGQIVVPPPKAVQQGTALWVTTHDPAPAGNLNARQTPKGDVIGYWPKDGAVEVVDVGSGDGWVLVHGPGVTPTTASDATLTDLQGWAWSGYLGKDPPANVQAALDVEHTLSDLGVV